MLFLELLHEVLIESLLPLSTHYYKTSKVALHGYEDGNKEDVGVVSGQSDLHIGYLIYLII